MSSSSPDQIAAMAREYYDLGKMIKDFEKERDAIKVALKANMEAKDLERFDTGLHVVTLSKSSRSSLSKEKLLLKGVTMSTIVACTDETPTSTLRVSVPKRGKL